MRLCSKHIKMIITKSHYEALMEEYHKRMKKAMTDVAKGKLTHKEALELYKKPGKASVRGSKGPKNTTRNKNTRKRELNKSGGK